MTCPRCADLEEQLAYLRSEHALADDAAVASRLRTALHIAPTTARVLMALYAAKGHIVTNWVLRENCCSYADSDDSRVIEVYVCRLRRKLGKEAIITLWGSGYRLSPEALSRVAEILEPMAVQG